MHDRDLPGGAAEADEAELEPEAERFGESDLRRGLQPVPCFTSSTPAP
jgi:hypothetical protein